MFLQKAARGTDAVVANGVNGIVLKLAIRHTPDV